MIAPFSYSHLIFAILRGMFFLGEHSDKLTFLGSAWVIASDLFTFWREHMVSKNLAYNQIDLAVAALLWSFINEWHKTSSPDLFRKPVKRKTINEHDC